MIDTLRMFDELQETMDVAAAKKIAEIIGLVYEDLQHTATKADLNDVKNDLKDVIIDLGLAQQNTEKRMEQLAEAQNRTEAKVEELAEAMKELALAQTRTQKEVGGLSMTIGYRLEDAAYQALPALLQRDYGILVHERLNRRYVQDGNNHDIEVNIFGKASRQDESLIILGESKAHLSKNDIDRFLRKNSTV